MLTPAQKRELYTLLNGLCEGVLSDDQFDRLDQWLVSDDQVRDIYVDFTKIWSDLRYFQSSFYSDSKNKRENSVIQKVISNDENLTDSAIWRALAADEKLAPELKMTEEVPPRELIQKVIYPHKKRKISKFQIFTLVINAAAILLLILFIKFVPKRQNSIDVATLVDQMNTKWAQADSIPKTGCRLWTNDKSLNLEKGTVKIQYDQGIVTLIEGPAKFKIDQLGIFLEYGRLYSLVSNSGIGFTVKTPSSQFVDLGTEFGVHADVNGSSELHVFKGKVQFFAGSDGTFRTSQLVTENKAVQYNAVTDTVTNISIQNLAFVRQFNSKLATEWRGQTSINLADIVGGGNGLGTGHYGYIVDQSGGEMTPKPIIPAVGWKKGPVGYTAVNSSPFIDGVFVPNGENKPVEISTKGDLFQECPDTNGDYWIGIQNGCFHQVQGVINEHTLTLGGIKVGTRQKPGIFMHANQGITFDLNEIRQVIPFGNITRFTSLCGVSDSVLDPFAYTAGTAGVSRDNGYMPVDDFWVLVDGKLRFSKKRQSPVDSAEDIDIPISSTDHFLTIIVTDSDKDISYDWSLFAEPELHFDSRP